MQPTSRDMAPRQPALLFVDDDEDLREIVRDVAVSLGIERCTLASSLAELEACSAEVSECTIAVLDINLGPDVPSGVDVYRWLTNVRFPGRVVFLTGHGADDPRVREAAQLGGVQIVSKPLGMNELSQLLGAR